MLLDLRPIPDLLARMEKHLEQGLASQERLVGDVREELRAEVRNRDAKIAALAEEQKTQNGRLSALEADKIAREGAEQASDKSAAKKTPWTAIAAIILSAFVALSGYVKDLIN